MNRSSSRGIFLSTTLLFSIMLIALPSDIHAEEITVRSFALGETTIMEIENNSNEEINTIRIWLASDFNFKSFKTEKGWAGDKNPQGVIVFKSPDPISTGESVKFGIKTDKPNSGINWKVLDDKDRQIGQGKVIAEKIPGGNQDSKQNKDPEVSMTKESVFRIVPEKPNIGSSIRVTGENFGASQEFDFYIDDDKIGTFETDGTGHFMTTMKIPDDQKAERVDFKVIDKNGEEKKMSLRIGEIENRISDSNNIPLTIKGIPNVVYRGDFLEIFGTGNPGSTITAKIITPDGEVINSRTAGVDNKGKWKLNEPIIVALDTPFGEYSATITDGREDKVINWTVESDKKIIVIPTSLKFEQGETMKFNGTALPNIPIEIIIEDPRGKEVVSDIIQVNGSGSLEFEFPTSQNTAKGTYTLIATQEKEKEFFYVGLGQLPAIPVNLEFDKLNYKKGETAIITLTGKASEIISLLIIDSSNKPIRDAVSITLPLDGRGTYLMDLDGFKLGAYTAVVSKGNAQSSEVFTVGLQTGSGEIKINTTKINHHPGDSVLILGDTGPNVLLSISMSDSNGKEIKKKETFSDKDGKISESSFRIPSDAQSGKWVINAKSGSNFANTEIEIIAVNIEGMIVEVEEGQSIPRSDKTVNIRVFGAQQTVDIKIIAEDGEVIREQSLQATRSGGEINLPWPISKNIEPGTYTIKANDAFNNAETTFEIR